MIGVLCGFLTGAGVPATMLRTLTATVIPSRRRRPCPMEGAPNTFHCIVGSCARFLAARCKRNWRISCSERSLCCSCGDVDSWFPCGVSSRPSSFPGEGTGVLRLLSCESASLRIFFSYGCYFVLFFPEIFLLHSIVV